MDPQSRGTAAAPLAVLSTGTIVLKPGENPDVAEFVKDRKAVKFMSKQDQLGLIAAARCARASGLTNEELNEAAIYASVGILPFEQETIDVLASKSTAGGRFDMTSFSTDAFLSLNPLLTFKCLPNMPVFHISWNLGIRGSHFITYPGAGQWARALERAAIDLRAGRVKHALVGGIGDQNNFLTRNYFERVGQGAELQDAASFWMLTLDAENPVARVRDISVTYKNFDVFAPRRPSRWQGPFDLPLEVENRRAGGARGNIDIEWSCNDGLAGRLAVEILS